jgi:hypothetical protein
MMPRHPGREPEAALNKAIERLAGAYNVSLERPDGLSDLLRAFLSDAPAVAKPMRRRPGRRAEVRQLEALVLVVESIRTGKAGEIKDCELRALAQNYPPECKATAMAIFGFLATDPSSPWNDQEAASLKNAYYRFKRDQGEGNIVVTSTRFVSMVFNCPPGLLKTNGVYTLSRTVTSLVIASPLSLLNKACR